MSPGLGPHASRFLAVRMDNAGDVLMLGPALEALRSLHPGAAITLLASRAGGEAAALLPRVDEVLTWRAVWQELDASRADPSRDPALVEEIRSRGFHAAFVFTSFRQSPHVPAYLCHLAGIPVRVGASKEWGGAVLTLAVPPPPDEVHQVDRNLRLVEAVGASAPSRLLSVRIPDADRAAARLLLTGSGVEPGRHLLVNPWTSAPARTYHPARMAEAAARISRRTDLRPLVVGTSKDRERSREVARLAGGDCVDLTGRTSLPQVAALVADAALVLTGNTSVMHLADAVGTPQVVLFSGTELPSQWEPRGGRARLLRRHTYCTPCHRLDCPIGLPCLDIPVEEVVEAAFHVLPLRAA